MPISSDLLYKSFVVIAPNAHFGQVLRALPAERGARAWTYVLQPQADGRYLAVLWKDVEQLVVAMDGVSDSQFFSSLDNLPTPVAAVEQNSMSVQMAKELREAQPEKCLVVLSAGQVIGLLYDVNRIGEPLGDDPFAAVKRPSDFSGPIVLSETEEPAEVPPAPESDAVAKDIQLPPSAAVLGEEPTAAAEPPAAEESPPPATDNRVINAWLEDVGGNDMPADKPLQIGDAYDLKFSVDAPKASAIQTVAIDVNKLFQSLPPEQKTVDLLVMIESDDFTINGDDQQLLKVPRTGRSRNTATFNIEPKHNGPGVVKAFFYANNRVFQKMTITMQVGEVATSEPVMTAAVQGLTMGSAMNSPMRQDTPVNLMIIKKEAGYQFILQGVGAMRAFLNLSETQIAELVAQTREVFKGIVYTLVNNQYVYQMDDTKIPEEVHQATLKAMAKHGTLMYRKLFYGPGSGPDARAMGDLLRKLSDEHQLHIEIVAERFTFPWSMLYSRADLKPDLSNVDPEGFWGFKHVIEYTPEFASATPINFVPEIRVTGKLGMSFVCNNGIDTQMKRPIIQGQRDYFQTLSDVSVTEHPTTTDLYALLNNPEQPSQVMYFYCHAVSNLPGEKGGVGGSKVILSDGPASLDDLNFAAGTDGQPLKNAPLVFMNCCQSAELSPYLYDGLVPYLITKGARGVIGTEVDTPALFAAEFAKDFLTRFFQGNKKLGDLLLEMRREYLQKKNNVMGLVYALHSSGEIYINRAG